MKDNKSGAVPQQEPHPEDYCDRCGIWIGEGSAFDRGVLCKNLCDECEDDVDAGDIVLDGPSVSPSGGAPPPAPDRLADEKLDRWLAEKECAEKRSADIRRDTAKLWRDASPEAWEGARQASQRMTGRKMPRVSPEERADNAARDERIAQHHEEEAAAYQAIRLRLQELAGLRAAQPTPEPTDERMREVVAMQEFVGAIWKDVLCSGETFEETQDAIVKAWSRLDKMLGAWYWDNQPGALKPETPVNG